MFQGVWQDTNRPSSEVTREWTLLATKICTDYLILKSKNNISAIVNAHCCFPATWSLVLQFEATLVIHISWQPAHIHLVIVTKDISFYIFTCLIHYHFLDSARLFIFLYTFTPLMIFVFVFITWFLSNSIHVLSCFITNSQLSFNSWYKFVLSNRCFPHQSTNQLLEDIVRTIGVNVHGLMFPILYFHDSDS